MLTNLIKKIILISFISAQALAGAQTSTPSLPTVNSAQPPVSNAQNTDESQKTNDLDKNDFWLNRKDEFMSPWTTPAKDWLLYGTGITIALILIDDVVDDPLQREVAEDHPLGKASKIGDWAGKGYINVAYVLGMWSHYLITRNENSLDNSAVMAKASLYAVAASTSLKFIAHEPRPNNTPTSKSYASFPSGHTTGAFSFASVVSQQNGFWPWGFAATSIAALTGFSRMNDNKHYLHDVVGGMTIGTSYGLGISYLARKKKEKKLQSTTPSTTKNFVFNILPVYDSEMKGLFIQYEF